MSNTTETIEAPETTEAEVTELFSEGQPPSYHSILLVWRKVLEPAEAESKLPVTPRWASRIVSTYAGVVMKDTVEVHKRYFAKVKELQDILEYEIATDEDCLKAGAPEEDLEDNSVHYKNLLRLWQMQILQWELDWSPLDKTAAAELAAISEVYAMFFGDTGLVSYLDNIRFEFDEDDQQELTEALNELKEGR